MDALTLSAGSQLDRATRWATLDPAERRRRAVTACRDRDAAELIDLTCSYLVLYSPAGSHLSPHTQAAYAAGIRELLAGWQAVNLLHAERDDAAVWIRTLEQRGLSAATVSVRLAGARALYRALRWARALEIDPLSDVRPARDLTPASEKRGPYSDVELDHLLAIADAVDRVLVLCGSHAGMRNAEICNLQWQHIDLASSRLTVVEGKGRKTVSVPVSRSLRDALTAITPEPATGHVLPFRTGQQARNRMKRLCAEAGVTYRAVHSLRHSAGTRLYRETGKLELCQDLLRHSNISTAQVYVHYADEEVQQSVGSW